MKKILLVSTFGQGAYAHVLKAAMIDMGYMVIPFDHREMQRAGYSISQIDSEFEYACKMYEPDYIFAVKGRGISPSVIKAQSATKINWWLDNVTRFSDFNKYIDAYDKYWIIEASQGHPWMAIGIYPPIHRPQPYTDQHESDVIFAGTGHPKRTERVESILRNMPFKNVIVGNSWEHLHDKSMWIRKAAYFQELYQHYAGAKMILNVHYYEGITPNMRTIEAPASGRPMISDTGEGIDECLTAGVDYIPYETVQEARYLIRKYMEEPEELTKIGRAGQRKVYISHNIKDKLGEMLN